MQLGSSAQKMIGIPNEYFYKMARQDYTQWKSAITREFVQNSVDAGATKIEIDFDKSSRTMTVTDNGCGMDEDILVNKLLVLGGSFKNEASVGSFGKAKELLFFSWKSYTIRTQDNLVTGCASQYSIEKAPFFKGTKAKIEFEDIIPFNLIRRECVNIVKKMQVKPKIYVDNIEIKSEYHRGRLQHESGWFKVYLNKSHKNDFVLFRINGIWMFDRFLEQDKGQIIVEMNNKSLEYLTSNRDALKFTYAAEVDRYLESLAVDSSSLLKDESKMVLDFLPGQGCVSSHRSQKFDTYKVTYSLGAINDEREIREVDSLKKYFSETSKDDGQKEIDYERLKNVVKNITDESFDGNKAKILEVVDFINYDPDFFVHRPQNQLKKVSTYLNKAKYQKIATIWTEIIKQVLLDNEIYTYFTAGFTFDNSVAAQYIHEKDGVTHIFLLNPLLIEKGVDIKNVYSNKKILAEYLVSNATHEIAHMFYPRHNEDFSIAEHTIRSKTWKSKKVYEKICK